jgi:N-acetylneuraminate synthase
MSFVGLGQYNAGEDHRPLVIAEAGINHNGDIDTAKKMVRAAKDAGADIVKFQTHIAEAEMLPDRELGSDAGSHVTSSLFDIMTECHLSLEDHLALKKESEDLGILFLSTPFSIEAVELLEKVGVPAYKVGSGEITNIPFLKYIAQKGRPVILSTGTASWDEVRTAVEAVKESAQGVILMQCTSNYPTPYSNVNLGVIDRMREEFKVPVGLSDHCTGNYACFGAIARNACVVEKHFTLSREMPGIDQQSSIEPHELKDLVEGVRAVWEALGSEKGLNEEALKVRHGFSESVVTIAPVKAGDELKEHVNIWVKRPGSGIPSYELPKITGKHAVRDIPSDTLIKYEDIS